MPPKRKAAAKAKRTRARAVAPKKLYPLQNGEGFIDDVGNVFKKVGNTAVDVVKSIKPSTALKVIGNLGVPGASAVGDVVGQVGLGRQRGHGVIGLVQNPSR